MSVAALFLVLAQMCIIFFFSSLTADTIASWGITLGPYSYLAHVVLYAGLGSLLYLMLLKMNVFLRLGYVWTLGFCFALADEVHQKYVAGRTFSVDDVKLDMLGIAVGIAVVAFLLRLKNKRIT
jgi:VanZ family protein